MKTIDPALLEAVTNRLVECFHPDQILLFGSHAWGEPDEDGDLDVLVIVTESDEPQHRRSARAYRSLRGLRVPVDVLVRTRREVDRYRRVPSSLEYEVMERGKVLYG